MHLNWIVAAEMKLLRPLAGHTLYDHKTNNSIRKELRITSILDKIDEYRKKWLLHIQRVPQNRIPLKSYNYRPQGRNQLDDLKNVGQSNYNPGDGTDQRVQSLVFMMMMTCIWLVSLPRMSAATLRHSLQPSQRAYWQFHAQIQWAKM